MASGVADGGEVGAEVDGDDVGALRGQSDGVAPALAAGRPGDQGHLAGHPARRRGRAVPRRRGPEAVGVAHGRRAPAPSADAGRPVGARARRWHRRPRRRSPAGGPPARRRGWSAGPRSHRPAGCPAARGRGRPRGAGGRSRPGRRSHGQRCSPVQTSSRWARPSGDRAEQRPQLAADAGPLQAGVGVGQVAGERQQGPGHLVLGDERHLVGRRRPATRPPPPRPGRRPGRGRPPARRGGRRRPPARSVRASTTTVWPSTGTGVGRAGSRWPAPPVRVGRARRPASAAGDLGARSRGSTPTPAHSRDQPVDQQGHPLAARAHGGAAAAAPPSSVVALDAPAPGGPGGPAPGRTRARPRPPPTTSTSVGRRIGAPDGRVVSTVSWPTAGLAHAADDRVAVVTDVAGLVAEDARPDPVGLPGADRRHQPGVGDLGPGHLDQVGHPVVEGRLRPRPGRRHCPAAPPGPARRRPPASAGRGRG